MSASGFRDRLRRLRRDPVQAEPGQVVQSTAALATHSLAETASGEPTGLETEDDGLTWFRRASYSLDAMHGDFALGEACSLAAGDFHLLTGDEALASLDLSEAIFLDTETTGLSGGAGTYVFMIGLGSFIQSDEGPRFEVWQGFLREPGGEAALLEQCAARVRARGPLVSFFGKSFDRHRLEDKMRLCGVEPPFEARPHLDLYHPCRRLYRGAYEDGKLKTMERELCGLSRIDDLPGAYAPEAWFDYLAERPHRIDGVFRHNLDDVLSLVTLAAHLGRSSSEVRAGGAPLSGDAATRAAGLARSRLKQGQPREAIAWLDKALEREHPAARELELQRATLQRKQGLAQVAQENLRRLIAAGEDRHAAHAWLELSKLLEHLERAPAPALEAARSAAQAAERTLVGREYATQVADLRSRIPRLERKCAGQGRTSAK